MHLELCRVCESTGQIVRQYMGVASATTCHGCNSKGQVLVPDEPRPLIVLPSIVIEEQPARRLGIWCSEN